MNFDLWSFDFQIFNLLLQKVGLNLLFNKSFILSLVVLQIPLGKFHNWRHYLLDHVAHVVFNFWKVHNVGEGKVSFVEVGLYVFIAACFRPLNSCFIVTRLASFLIQRRAGTLAVKCLCVVFLKPLDVFLLLGKVIFDLFGWFSHVNFLFTLIFIHKF